MTPLFNVFGPRPSASDMRRRLGEAAFARAIPALHQPAGKAYLIEVWIDPSVDAVEWERKGRDGPAEQVRVPGALYYFRRRDGRTQEGCGTLPLSHFRDPLTQLPLTLSAIRSKRPQLRHDAHLNNPPPTTSHATQD
jgi:hypothetical protein